MNKYLIVGFVILLVFVSACTSRVAIQCNAPYALINNACCLDENKNGVCDDQEVQKTPVEQQQIPPPQPPVVISPPKEEPKKEEPQPEQPKQEQQPQETAPASPTTVDVLIDKANKVKTVSYVFEGKQIEIMGDIMRAELTKYFKPDREHPVNTVYINMQTKKAKAYCEGTPKEQALICEKDNKGPFDVDATEYYSKTPKDWLMDFRQMTPKSVEPEAQVIQSRHTDKWTFEKNGLTYNLWVDSAYGLPIRIKIMDGDKTQFVDYPEMYFDTVQPDIFQGKI